MRSFQTPIRQSFGAQSPGLRAIGAAVALASLLTFVGFGDQSHAQAETTTSAVRGKPQFETRSLLGSYLAGRIARGQHDTAAAADFYNGALTRDPGNESLLQEALVTAASEGRFDEAIANAKLLAEAQPTHRIARLVLGLADAKVGRHAAAVENFKASATGLMGELTGALARSWSMTALGDVKGAIELLDSMRQAEWAQFYLRYHKALILDVAGRGGEARAIYERVFRSDAKSLRVALAYAHSAAAAGDVKLARSVLDDHAKKTGGILHPVGKALQDRLKDGATVPLLVQDASEGMAEVFYGLGEALSGEGGIQVGAVYLQMALYLKPETPFALASLANVFEATKRYQDAIDAYDRIPTGSPLQQAIEIRKALNLNQLERVDDAKALLEKVAAEDPTDVKALDALGTIMRGRKRFEEAVDYYTRVLGIVGSKNDKKNWSYYYARGTSYERIKKWPLAEADLLKAMQMAPDQPLVLNYLGYSWVDQNKNLKQGLQLIEKAVQLKPDDGYIVDSLGWAHYRLGNYKEAAKFLERAVELAPQDPVLNDHLGDALWQVGRRTEARYQWEQSLTLKPEPDDAERTKKKIEKGLTAKAEPRVAKKSAKEAAKPEGPRRQTKLAPQRPILQ